MRSFKPLLWLVAGLICLGGTDAMAKEKKVDWSEYLEPKGGSKTQLTPTSGKATKATKVTTKKKKAVAKKSAKKSKKAKRSAKRR